MKDFLVDVPVRVNIWIRPECQKKQWEVIKKARPSILFLQSDGGRNEKEWESILSNRKMIDESIDWDCSVYRLYEIKNNGLYEMSKKMTKLIWSKVDRCIFLEDDQIMSVSFFRFCSEMLEKYKNDERVECICGMNHLGIYERVDADYFFARQGSIWGVATWRRVLQNRNNFDYSNSDYTMWLLNKRTSHNKIAKKRYKAYSVKTEFEGHVPGSEFWIEFDMYSQNRLQLICKYNLISNIGNTSDSEHSNDGKYLSNAYKKIYNTKIYELAFPLKTTNYIIPDVFYEKKRNRIMAYNHPFISVFRKGVQFLKMLFHGDFKALRKKIKQRNSTEK